MQVTVNELIICPSARCPYLRKDLCRGVPLSHQSFDFLPHLVEILRLDTTIYVHRVIRNFNTQRRGETIDDRVGNNASYFLDICRGDWDWRVCRVG